MLLCQCHSCHPLSNNLVFRGFGLRSVKSLGWIHQKKFRLSSCRSLHIYIYVLNLFHCFHVKSKSDSNDKTSAFTFGRNCFSIINWQKCNPSFLWTWTEFFGYVACENSLVYLDWRQERKRKHYSKNKAVVVMQLSTG